MPRGHDRAPESEPKEPQRRPARTRCDCGSSCERPSGLAQQVRRSWSRCGGGEKWSPTNGRKKTAPPQSHHAQEQPLSGKCNNNFWGRSSSLDLIRRAAPVPPISASGLSTPPCAAATAHRVRARAWRSPRNRCKPRKTVPCPALAAKRPGACAAQRATSTTQHSPLPGPRWLPPQCLATWSGASPRQRQPIGQPAGAIRQRKKIRGHQQRQAP